MEIPDIITPKQIRSVLKAAKVAFTNQYARKRVTSHIKANTTEK